ncbi:GmrSD restriction endonuclease domain-containing protein [Pseudoalteromonas arctica]|uniref:DUF262 domain-containing protein n=1 Tax=Pseudoalteromonas arctica TaxID=394751 RepID=A0A7Y0DS26_9GAMM|nr:DUF262 domain-containing protein [Pseudoalteromonas arctica]
MKIFDDCFYQVPDYQRPYSWDKDNLDDLIEDLTSSYLAKMEDTYFCGSLVLVISIKLILKRLF